MNLRDTCFISSLVLASFLPSITSAQTAEDSLRQAGPSSATAIGGYGNAVFQRDANASISTVNLERVVLFIGHSFGSISFFSELEVEDAKVSGGEEGGEVAFEQAYLRFNLGARHYLAAGLFLPRIGIINENHLPTDFNGNERPQVETLVIPSTWRELGIGFYGGLETLPLNYSIALVNGLNSASFAHGNGIREGRFEGREASANNLAVTGSVQYFLGSLRLRGSGYYGGTVGLARPAADTLGLDSGLFGTPVALGEVDVTYETGGFTAKVLGTAVTIPKAFEINRAYGSQTPSQEYGAYAELGYDLLHGSDQSLVVFGRYERLNLNAKVPSNAVTDGSLDQGHFIVGAGYFPVSNVVIKTDVRFVHTGDQHPAFGAGTEPSRQSNTYLTLGIGYSF